MVIVIRPIVPAGSPDFFVEADAAGVIGRNRLSPLTFFPQGTTGLNNNPTPARAANSAPNIGADFGCICYEWTPAHTALSHSVVWIGHGATTGGPDYFPRIADFYNLICYSLTAAASPTTLPQTALPPATPPSIGRLVFISCHALNYITIHLPAFINRIKARQTADLDIEASSDCVYSGRIRDIFTTLTPGPQPRSINILSRICLTTPAADQSTAHFMLRLTLNNVTVYGYPMFLQSLTDYRSQVFRHWRSSLPTAGRIDYENLWKQTTGTILPHTAPRIHRPMVPAATTPAPHPVTQARRPRPQTFLEPLE